MAEKETNSRHLLGRKGWRFPFRVEIGVWVTGGGVEGGEKPHFLS